VDVFGSLHPLFGADAPLAACDRILSGAVPGDGARALIERIGGEPASRFAMDRFDELFRSDPDHWCALAMAAPDRRLIARLDRRSGASSRGSGRAAAAPRRPDIGTQRFQRRLHLIGRCRRQ
jgi:hypothetical protein